MKVRGKPFISDRMAGYLIAWYLIVALVRYGSYFNQISDFEYFEFVELFYLVGPIVFTAFSSFFWIIELLAFGLTGGQHFQSLFALVLSTSILYLIGLLIYLRIEYNPLKNLNNK
jgi:hypothetical protein